MKWRRGNKQTFTVATGTGSTFLDRMGLFTSNPGSNPSLRSSGGPDGRSWTGLVDEMTITPFGRSRVTFASGVAASSAASDVIRLFFPSFLSSCRCVAASSAAGCSSLLLRRFLGAGSSGACSGDGGG